MSVRVKYDRNGAAEIVGEDEGAAQEPMSDYGSEKLQHDTDVDSLLQGAWNHDRRRRYGGLVGCRVARTSSATVGLIFDKSLPNGSYTTPVPTKYRVVVYQLMEKRFGGTKFWQQDSEFTEDSQAAAEKRARDYIASQGWVLQPFSENPAARAT